MTKRLPSELRPAYERSVDLASIDSRMNSQLEFNDRVDALKRRRVETGGASNKLRRVAAGAGILLVAAGAVELIGRAADQSIREHTHSMPTLTNSGHEK